MQDTLQQLEELGLGSRLNRLSEYLMKETQLVYDALHIDFDPYLFPIFKIVADQKTTTNSEIQQQLQYTQPAITQALKKLFNKALIHYKVDPIDKRKKIVSLTPKGHKTHQQMIPLWQVIDTQIKWLTEGSATNLIHHITHLENQLRKKSLSTRVLENLE
ncbi:MarR family winged helix-turn-helix transcriptional regulator [Aquimarina sp. RZ0]|uniref:MarR family winged helix-turn-helix transcriptional regulator n=1 Tax=Aquimarina sp. RZ0 TaxID=2607730 RepID=UPI0011F2D382|nr:winged helix DNA-binding protein [Aquimarina sp. RZ0]KAA1247455.1 winged helix DNA-binding protein [Aquimarina sp. RZ0]